MTTTYVSGVLVETTVQVGDTIVIESGGQSEINDIEGNEIVQEGGISSNDVASVGGTITVETGGYVVGPVIDGGTLDLEAPSINESRALDLDFEGSGGVLELNASENLVPDVNGFVPGDEISILGLSTSDPVVISVDRFDVDIFDGGQDYKLELNNAGQYELTTVDVDGKLTLECVCFTAGTAIATPNGSRSVETLAAGDLVMTEAGEARPVRWLGRQTVVTRFADPLRVAPIRIRAGALGENLPIRDLHVSPDHAIMVDGLFVQAGALVNGVSITREAENLPETLVYFHVELADHALIVAEGVAAETFIDNVDRLAFDNWDEHAALDAATAPLAEMAHPRAKSHRQVPKSVRARLLARAVELTSCDTAAA